jgi:capsular exopolysaccharide synthesis family protein
MKAYSIRAFAPSPLRLKRVLRKHLLTVISTISVVVGGVAIYTFTQPFIYESKATFLIENTLEGDNNISTQAKILSSTAIIEAALPKIPADLSKDLSKEQLLKQISENLVITTAQDAKILNISYGDRSPKSASEILQALVTTFKAYGVTKASQSTKLIETKIPEAKQQLEQTSKALTRFRQQYNITDPDSYAASIYTMKQGLETQAQELQIKMAQSQRQLQELQRQVGKPADVALSSAILSEDSNYQALVKQFQEAQTNYFLERTRFQEAHPRVQALRERRDQIYKLMQAQAVAILGGTGANIEVSTAGQSSIKQNLITQLFETQTRIATQSAELGSLRAAQAKVALVFAQIPQLQQTYVELQRQFKAASNQLTQLSQKLEELKILEARESGSWQILESPSVPNHPVSPNILLNLLLGGLGGVLFALILVAILENSDDRLQEVAQLKSLSTLPLLGAVPYLSIDAKLLAPSPQLISDQAFLPPSHGHSAFTEAVNSLALNIRNLGSERPLKTIAFTSSIPSEGKSTLIYNLGLTLADLGHKVLLIDADMRKPTLHTLAGISNKLGLSQAIATKLPWQQIIHTGDNSQFSEGYLHLIPAGATPPNPMILLESHKMAKLLQEWYQIYDYVLIDTPPIVGITDAQSLAPKMDGVVLVTAIEKATKQAIARAMEILKINNCKVVGILVNLVDKNDNTYCYDYSTSEYYNRPSQPLLRESNSDS